MHPEEKKGNEEEGKLSFPSQGKLYHAPAPIQSNRQPKTPSIHPSSINHYQEVSKGKSIGTCLDQFIPIVLVSHTLHHDRSSLLLRTPFLLPLADNSLLAFII